jgi:hypothetical protein
MQSLAADSAFFRIPPRPLPPRRDRHVPRPARTGATPWLRLGDLAAALREASLAGFVTLSLSWGAAELIFAWTRP